MCVIVWVCVKLDTHKVNKRNQTTLLSLQLPIPWFRFWSWPILNLRSWTSSIQSLLSLDCERERERERDIENQLAVVSCQLAVTSWQTPLATRQLPVANWQLLCFVNRLRHFCLPYALRDDLVDKARSSDKQDCCGWSAGMGDGSLTKDITMWPRQIVYSLSVCSFAARAINSEPESKSKLHLNWARISDELALFLHPTTFGGFCGVRLASFDCQLRTTKMYSHSHIYTTTQSA